MDLSRKLRWKAYQALWDARVRCNNPRHRSFRHYGARGIRVCARWSGPGGFDAFLQDVGLPPTLDHTLDRIDFGDSYRPGNVRWATWQEQGRNKRETVRFHFDGATMTLPEWAAKTGVPYHTLNKRIKLLGWPIEKALSAPIRWTTSPAKIRAAG
jgi:hypothetical protein